MGYRLLDEELWQEIAPLIPGHRLRRRCHPGRRAIDHKHIFMGILFVLKAGLPWQMLPTDLGLGCGETCRRHLVTWHRRGIWKKIRQHLLSKMNRQGQIDWSRALVDSSSIRAVFGG